MSIDVKLPREVKAQWPDRCVRCEAEAPGGWVRLWTHSIGWWTVALFAFGMPFSVRVPACPSCAMRIRAVRWLTTLVYCVGAFAAVAIAFWVLGGYAGPGRRWLAMALALVCMAPIFILRVFLAPVIDVTCYAKSVEYEFSDAEYAAEFAVLNGGEIV